MMTSLFNSHSNAHDELQQQQKVEHIYRDHSHEVDPATRFVEWTGRNGLLPQLHASPSESKNQQSSFPVRLHYILSGELEQDHMDYIVSWQPHGRCFLVHNREDFVEKVLPSWFSQRSYASFQRQLNLYGFKRLSSGPDKGGYYHELFLRGKGFLAARIQRTKVKGTGGRKACNPEAEPDFYQMPFVGVDKVKSVSNLTLRGFLSVNNTVLPPAMASTPRMTTEEAHGGEHQRASLLAQRAATAAAFAHETAAAVQRLHLQQQLQRHRQMHHHPNFALSWSPAMASLREPLLLQQESQRAEYLRSLLAEPLQDLFLL